MYDQPATSRLLISELFTFVREVVKGYPFPSPDGKWLDCHVFLHGMPEELEAGVYPFVLVRWMDGEVFSDKDSKTVLQDNVALILGVTSPRAQAEAGLLLAELMDCLRRAIWAKRLLADRFELVEPLRSTIQPIQQQAHRFHMATIETVWNYVWPPKALEEAGQSQLQADNMSIDSYSESELALAKGQSKIWGNNER